MRVYIGGSAGWLKDGNLLLPARSGDGDYQVSWGDGKPMGFVFIHVEVVRKKVRDTRYEGIDLENCTVKMPSPRTAYLLT
jgi:hypothetical protein